ncbi:hypothetical protein Btru_043956 [Bulinus truncatus]|nr:hypothetical protein Btru_043956 [Bulinus truncatus]
MFSGRRARVSGREGARVERYILQLYICRVESEKNDPKKLCQFPLFFTVVLISTNKLVLCSMDEFWRSFLKNLASNARILPLQCVLVLSGTWHQTPESFLYSVCWSCQGPRIKRPNPSFTVCAGLVRDLASNARILPLQCVLVLSGTSHQTPESFLYSVCWSCQGPGIKRPNPSFTVCAGLVRDLASNARILPLQCAGLGKRQPYKELFFK